MKFLRTHSLKEIATIIGCKYVGDDQFPVDGMNEIHVVSTGDIVFVDHPKYYEKALQSAATIILINKEVDCPVGKALLISDDPFRDFNTLTKHFRPFVSSGSSISSTAFIGENTIIQPNCFIGNNVSIGHNAIVHGCTIHNNVLIGMGAIVMDNCVIESNSIIAAGAVVTQNTVVQSGSIYAGVPAKKVKDIDQSDFAGEIERIANNYVMYSGWDKKEK